MKTWQIKVYYRNGSIITRLYSDYDQARKDFISYWIPDIFKVTLEKI